MSIQTECGSISTMLPDCNAIFSAIEDATAHAWEMAKARGEDYIKIADFRKGLYLCSELGGLISDAVALRGEVKILFTRHTVKTTAHAMIKKGSFTAHDFPIEVSVKARVNGEKLDVQEWLELQIMVLVTQAVNTGVGAWDGTEENHAKARIESMVCRTATDSEDLKGRKGLERAPIGTMLITADNDYRGLTTFSGKLAGTMAEARAYLQGSAARLQMI
jgi:hypothetical protein